MLECKCFVHFLQPNHIFGHGGYGGQYGAADVKYRLGFAYTTSFLDALSSYSNEGDERLYSLVNAMYDCVFELENIKEKRQLFKFYSKFKSYMDQTAVHSKL